MAGRLLDTKLSEMSDAEPRLRWVSGALWSTPQFWLSNSGPDRIGSESAIVVEESSFSVLCEGLSSVLFAPGVMNCGNEKVTVTLP
ncbi:MAG TPA: hypothetical protein EYN06_07465 [Myxococcales bacterium]|nr:hypothetical protein [Myxococcales bacterium]HIN86302.1 hypothetical protein [Myxococcales bacterium]